MSPAVTETVQSKETLIQHCLLGKINYRSLMSEPGKRLKKNPIQDKPLIKTILSVKALKYKF